MSSIFDNGKPRVKRPNSHVGRNILKKQLSGKRKWGCFPTGIKSKEKRLNRTHELMVKG